ncbi:MAG: D-tyrosyl-tRNA(Tyr) deacylase [Candidatus Omnitrophica bacterium]|nr:D-tyrosyl-tRNA(Tyr) deacylase [Candidatus Omnitrophota bacterium]
MRAVIQRVREARVRVEGRVVGEIGPGICLLLGVHQSDTLEEVEWLALKTAQLRIFEDSEGKMNFSLQEIGGSALVVSQFTLYADCRKGRRPSFVEAARPEVAVPLYESFCKRLRLEGVPVETGVFGAKMEVEIVNDGPVTVILESPPGAFNAIV